ncbi:3'-5' exonuclease [Myceligenerans indicum]|uniref:DNA 3'-5' helicase n=1 Tax=Myceligenerans indicum TaxID=2593663 RepID=A0ABS1LQ19_9MICO|nr:3'-5' exonuclease [Myceligenerans indicum]MBL0888300.1 ATP-dependent helicase [Myceligenerans indicum]
MAQVHFGPRQKPPLDGSVRSAAYSFIDKLREDDTAPGLHIEPISGAADPRIRTGRVTRFWRAVLTKFSMPSGDTHYIYLGTYPHDDAIELAKKVVVRVNPLSGITELVDADRLSMPEIHERTTIPSEKPKPPTSLPGADPFVPTSLLVDRFGISMTDLLALGVHEGLATLAVTARTQDELADVVVDADAPAWQQEVLLDLGTGSPLDDVRTRYQLGAAAGDSDEDVVAALAHPASRLEFSYIQDDQAMRAAIEDDDFGRWRVFLHPEQQDYAFTPRSGAFRLSGGAGTGKTVVLLHRARHLARANPDARIVLTTYNKTLAEALRENLRLLDRTIPVVDEPGTAGVFIGTVDAVSWRLLARSRVNGLPVDAAVEAVFGTLRGTRSNALDTSPDSAWRTALSRAGFDLPDSLRNPGFLAAEYVTVILPARITALDAYLTVARTGRGVALDRTRRRAVWEVIEAYRALSAEKGTTDYNEKAILAAAALDLAAAAGVSRPADHVLVDEAQDLTPSRLLLLRALVTPGPDDLYLAEDSRQRIYVPRVVLAQHGIAVRGRSRRLTLNYRTTAQNLDLATTVLDGSDLADMEGGAVAAPADRSARSGPPPQLIGLDSLEAAYESAAHILRGWLERDLAPETLCVLVRSGEEGAQLTDELTLRGLPVLAVGSKQVPGPGRISVMTMHRSKGMEFRNVILFGLTPEATSTQLAFLPDGDKPDALQRERALLYVATTRARDELVVMWDGERSDLLPVRV